MEATTKSQLAAEVQALRNSLDEERAKSARLEERLTDAHAQIAEAREHQTATNEILRVISQSPTDVQPVFHVIAQSARRLCDGNYCTVARYDGELVHLAAHAYIRAEGVDAMGQFSPCDPVGR